MNREKALLATAAVVVVLALLAAASVPGVLADRDEPLRPAIVEHRGSAITADAVTGERVTLGVQTVLGHRGGPARNVTVRVQAYDVESGILVTEARTRLDTLDEEREYDATTPVTVPREGAYRIETTVYVDGERRERGRQTVSGLGTLVPERERTTVRFQDFETRATTIPSITYSIDSVRDGRATLDVLAYLTNAGDDPEAGLELAVLARQAESNIVADRATVSVGEIGPGETHTPGVSLSVPDEHNYHLDAILRRGEVIVATASAPASLDPTETVPRNRTTREVGLDTSEFVSEDDPPRTEVETAGDRGPGFTVLGGLLAVTIAAFARRYR